MALPAEVPEMDARAIIEQGGRVLIVRARGDEPHGGLWTFPGGSVEASQTPEGSLRGCIRDRLGLSIEIAIGQPPFVCEVLGRSVTFRYFSCGVKAGEPSGDWWPEAQWVSRAQLREYDFEPQAKQVADWLIEQT